MLRRTCVTSVLALLWPATWLGCQRQPATSPSATATPATSAAPAASDSATGDSASSATPADEPFQPMRPPQVRVFSALPRFRLTDQTGQTFTSEELSGKVWVATFIFTRCQQTCPQQTAEFAKLQQLFQRHPARDSLRLVSITVDPEFDTPQVLARYAQQHQADPARWTFLTAKRDHLRELSEKGFMLPMAAPQPAGPIGHSQQFVLIDRARRIRGYYDGLNATARDKLLKDLEQVLNDPLGAVTEPKRPEHALQSGPRIYEPREILNTPWLAERADAQRKMFADAPIMHDFSFTDQLPDSGITFVNRVVDDAAKFYKAVHYDHGNGLAVADVDGDGLYDVYFVNQRGANQLYRNQGGGKFQNITAAAGVAVEDGIKVSASFADTDNDGDADLYVTTVRRGNLLFENDGQGHFRDVSQASGLDYVGHSSAAIFFDYDRDGLLDMFLTNPGKYTTDKQGAGGYYVGYPDAFTGHLDPQRTERSILFHNLGNHRFEDASRAMQLEDESWTGAGSPVDLNADGWIDLFLVNMQGHDEYYENEQGKRFIRKSREVFPATAWGSMGIKCFDFDNDQLIDILTTDMHSDMIDETLHFNRLWHSEKMKMTDRLSPRFLKTDGNHILGNALFHNQGNGQFRDISEDVGAETYWPWGVSVGDVNADGFDDVFVTASMNYPYRYAINSLLLNHRGRELLDSEFVLGVEPRRDGRTSQLWFTLDADGVDREHPLCKGRSGPLEVWGSLGSRSSVIFDLDNDGDLDLVTNDFHSEPMVLISDLAQRKPDLRYLQVRLQGKASNRDGLGAKVTVVASGKRFLKVHDGQSGYMSQSALPLYFGLGSVAEVEAIEVEWPSAPTGDKQIVPGPIPSNQVFVVREE